MAQTERVALFLRGDTYKVCSVQIWLISMHIYFVKITIQWSFHRIQNFVDEPKNLSDVHTHMSKKTIRIFLKGGRSGHPLCQVAWNFVLSFWENVGSESHGLGRWWSCLQASHFRYVASFSVVVSAL